MARSAPVLPEAPETRDLNSDQQRMVEVRLSPAWPANRPVKLLWNTGKSSPGSVAIRTKKTLYPGDKTMLDIGKARAFFGLFTVPHDMEDVLDEKIRDDMWAAFTKEKARKIMEWGDSPRPINFMKDGMEPIGPARLPDVYLTVIEPDGERWEEIRLRDMYDLGDFVDVDIRPRMQWQNNDAKESDDVTALRAEVSRLEALITGFFAGNKAAPITEAEAERPAPPKPGQRRGPGGGSHAAPQSAPPETRTAQTPAESMEFDRSQGNMAEVGNRGDAPKRGPDTEGE